MIEYRRSVSEYGTSYAKLVEGEWVPIADDEAKRAGVWRDPRGGQYHVKDPFATPDQLKARAGGRYDPRPASGAHIAFRVGVFCGNCDVPVAEVHEYELRLLTHNLQTGRWYFSQIDRWGPFQCHLCDRGSYEVDLDKIKRTVFRAAERKRKLTVKV